MTTTCPMRCQPRQRSRVVETRTKPARTVVRGKRLQTLTIVRLRECLHCRFRWRTVEVPYAALLNRRGALSANNL